jgi:ABC-type branched-subunit amino acid transport system ATPase component
MSNTILEVQGLCKYFGGVKAVDGINLKIPKNAIQTIIGPNGAGKSTTLNLLSGTYFPTHGKVTYNQADVTALKLHQRVHLGMARTFQKIRLFKQLSVIDNVIAGFHIHHKIPFWHYFIPAGEYKRNRLDCYNQALELLDFIGLKDKANERAGSLPYGSQRMLEIARALATKPKVFMLDEPAAGLNDTEVQFLMSRLRHLQTQNMTIILVEHNMKLVMNIADQIFVMDHGEYLFDGSPSEVQSNPKVIAAYLGSEGATV